MCRTGAANIRQGMRCLAGAAAVLLVQSASAYAQRVDIAPGIASQVIIPGKTYPQGRLAWVYTPAGYPAVCRKECNLIIAFDGAMYMLAMSLPEILDSLIAVKQTPPTVAVMLDNGQGSTRISDLGNSSRFAGFVADELLPWVRKRYAVTHSANRTTLAGASAGGLAAAFIALKYPSLFGNVLSQSGAYWRGNEVSSSPPYEWLTRQYETLPRADIRFFMDVGLLESGDARDGSVPSLLDANRNLREVLKAKGYSVEYFEVPNGEHSVNTWRTRLPAGIVSLAPIH